MSTTFRDPMRVLVIVASTRPGRLGTAIADWFVRVTKADAEHGGIAVDVAHLAELDLPLLDEPEHPSEGAYVHEHTRRWSQRVAAADAFVMITPEYNYGMPGSLKNALDFLYHEWAWKPVAFVSYGNTSAGTRSVQMTKQVVTTLRMMPIGATVALRIADSTSDGQVVESMQIEETARGVLAELTRVADAMHPLRADAESVGGPIDGLTVDLARPGDLAEVLVLQRCCWVEEALANDTLDLAPLHETLDELRESSKQWRLWCVRRHGRLIAAVRARAHGATWMIGRLMVAPDYVGKGIGSWLLEYAEQMAPAEATQFALFTGQRSERNIGLYERAGYALTSAESMPPHSVYLTKQRALVG
ncbi:GNAT family N-acetyltransferase [Solicola gregarius]|uniref:Bifunctional NAD(P)H-dependent oxidoreductase/GNAT family N-acetyltransferase n=1 Tax=Solicola gregarius TaxID=2908642 RepID=A0AA46TEQ4_9ACTN|nr:GNAT family N-acetyltransferase [Solicola gregarius]UYM03976.1 bifunctional NAD(P)H-dependent oxidoreductase/GNAT family N-acetyltransferase [Solicola gregarius]